MWYYISQLIFPLQRSAEAWDLRVKLNEFSKRSQSQKIKTQILILGIYLTEKQRPKLET